MRFKKEEGLLQFHSQVIYFNNEIPSTVIKRKGLGRKLSDWCLRGVIALRGTEGGRTCLSRPSRRVSQGQGGDSSTDLSSFQVRLPESALRFLESMGWRSTALNQPGQFAACPASPPRSVVKGERRSCG